MALCLGSTTIGIMVSPALLRDAWARERELSLRGLCGNHAERLGMEKYCSKRRS
jgi:hypothetical protein